MKATNMNFEESMTRLEEIVRRMERGDIPLDESLKLFQEGAELAKNCSKLLDDAELKVKKISAGSDAEPVEEEFESEGTV